MSENILNVYEFQSENNTKSYIYSLKKDKYDLSFKYYILTKDDNLESTIYESSNTLDRLQTNNIKLIPIEKDSTNYQEFLVELKQVLKKIQPKEKVTCKK